MALPVKVFLRHCTSAAPEPKFRVIVLRAMTPAPEQPLVEARGLHAYYGASHVLHGLDFSVRAGEAVGLMGRNGMGKTTLLKTLFGLVRARSGKVTVKGRDMTHAAPHAIARAGIAYVPEGRGIFPNLSVWENLMMAARPGVGGRRDWTLSRVLESFPRLGERLDHGGAQLSGGEQQMLAIGRALMTNPDLLVLDEATEGLAPMIAQEIWAIIRHLKDEGIATVIVDKNFAAVSVVADRAVILVKGAAVFAGSAAELRARPELHVRHLGV
jgi:branched-chain amino acid transport system ATP-binding protein